MLAEEPTPTSGNKSSVERVLRTLLRRVSAIVLVAVVVAGAALGFSLYQPPTYEASIKILVGQKNSDSSLAQDASDIQDLTLTIAKAVRTAPVAQGVVEQLNLPEVSAAGVLNNMSAEPDPGTMFVNVSYKSSDPERAQLIANTTGQVLEEKISEVSIGANGITAMVWAPATLPQTPVAPDPVRNTIIALVLGSLLGVVLAFLLEYIDDSWNSPEEVEEISGVPAFGVIPRYKALASKKGKILAGKGEGGRVTLLDPPGRTSEAYRSLRTSLLYAVVDEPPTVIVVTSPGSADGKSSICANLAVVLAQAGKDILVIDCDMRRPSLHRIFGVSNVSGVTNVLVGEHGLSEVWKEPSPDADHLKMVSTGPVPPNPSEILGTARFSRLLANARQEFDYVLIDSPPTGAVSDPMIIATQADAVLLVVDSERTSKRALRKAMRDLEAVGANVLGTVINKVPEAETDRYGYDY